MGNKTSSPLNSPANRAAIDKVLTRPTSLTSSLFDLVSCGHHGLPSNVKTMAFCALQGVLAIGTANGAIKLYGQPPLEIPIESTTQPNGNSSVSQMKFTGLQHLVVTFSDSSIRIYEFSSVAQVIATVPAMWTLHIITCVETFEYSPYPFVFVATDDGSIHVFHEETGKKSTYVISRRDVGLADADEEDDQAESERGTHERRNGVFVTSMKLNPKDPNQLLVGYQPGSKLVLFDLSKHKVIREYTAVASKQKQQSQQQQQQQQSKTTESSDLSVKCLAWHASGKRFVAGYQGGGFSMFRVDKPHGLLRYLDATNGAKVDDADSLLEEKEEPEESSPCTRPISQVEWLCAPPNSRVFGNQLNFFPGVLAFTGGKRAQCSKRITLLYPSSSQTSGEDVLTELAKAEKLSSWAMRSITSVNEAEISSFVVACDQIDYSSKPAPLALILLSGNPLDGCLPCVSVQCLPLFMKQANESTSANAKDNEIPFQFDPSQLVEPVVLPPLLYLSPLKSFSIVSLAHSDGTLQEDLATTWPQDKIDPLERLVKSKTFEWPVNGGAMNEPLLHRFLPGRQAASKQDETHTVFQNDTLLITGHENGWVMFWEVIPPAEHTSKGSIRLLHVIDCPLQMDPPPSLKEVTCTSFCADARVLIVGFKQGEIAVLEFGHWKKRRPSSLLETHFSAELADDQVELDHDASSQQPTQAASSDLVGFRTLFTMHVHAAEITRICISSSYGYAAIADASGMVSLVQLATQMHELLIFEISLEEPVSVDSLLMSELVQEVEVPAQAGVGGDAVVLNSAPGAPGVATAIRRTIVPVLIVGRGNGKIEMFHIQTATKIGEYLVDTTNSCNGGVSSIIMLDPDGKPMTIPGRVWSEQGEAMENVDEHLANTDSIVGQQDMQADAQTQKDGTDESTPQVPSEPSEATIIRHVRSPSTELDFTQQVVTEIMSSQASTDDVVLIQKDDLLPGNNSQQTTPKAWHQTNPIEVVVPPGALGLHLFVEIEQHAVVKGFAAGNPTAALIEAAGVHSGHVMTKINGLDITHLSRDLVCAVLEKLKDREKVILFTEGYGSSPSKQEIGVFNELLGDGQNYSDVKRPRFLLCTCGKNLYLVVVTFPKTVEIASGVSQEQQPMIPLASVEVQAPIVTTCVVRVPVRERTENCVAVLDQSNTLYLLSLMSLKLVRHFENCPFGNLFDGLHVDCSFGGEVFLWNSTTSEIARFSMFARETAAENALLQRKCIKTKIFLFEREQFAPKDPTQETSLNENSKSPQKKKRSMSFFKKLVSKESVTKQVDLHQVFVFSKEAQERQQLLGDRHEEEDADQSNRQDQKGTERVSSGIGATKQVLAQASQRLHERGDKLSDLAQKTEQMKNTSEDFYRTMKALNDKNAKKKWYEF